MSLTARRLRELFTYSEDSGVFSRRVAKDGRFHIGQQVGTRKDNGYLHFSIDGRKYMAHRLAWLYVHGEWPVGDIDHIDGNRANNRIGNLRAVSRAVNLQNLRAPKSHNKSTGLLGAYRHESGRFTSRIKVSGRDKYLGLFDTAEQAHAAYLAAKREMHEGSTL